MPTGKKSFTVDLELLAELERQVRHPNFGSRSQVLQVAVRDELNQLERNRLICECRRLNPKAEQAFADADLNGDLSGWPLY